ncbi:MAG: UvrD-helicase domain-containing protein [Deltaproteobacteria bacterium]|jgi:uncharacterized protein (TIGR00375 family)|nr:UvrD-helicase domain-containing protein [Deltaproteobacteria bacterium]
MLQSEFRADLHIHSRFSRATSGRLNVPLLAGWAALKGLRVLGSGDFTHPLWRKELLSFLEYEESSGLYRLKRPEEALCACPEAEETPWALERIRKVRFLPQTEISSIYKRDGKVRKIHNLVFLPRLEAAEKFCLRLERVGNLHSDGRPILGLDARNVLELTLESDPEACLIPAHIWTPWFSLFGSKSGFDRIEDCFGPLTEHIFALETGLSSDPEMNRRLSSLDRFTLVSNSDAHSGENLAREANLFAGELSYAGIFSSLRGDAGKNSTTFLGTCEFFPDEGKYHLDGHRACGVTLTPEESLKLGGICPVCGKPLTLGVLHRVSELADRQTPRYREKERFVCLIPLPEILGEILGAGPKSAKTTGLYRSMLRKLGPELDILQHIPPEELEKFSPGLAEGMRRMRRGEVIRQGGYDGEFGVIRVFSAEEARELKAGRFNPAGGRVSGLLPGLHLPEPPPPPGGHSSGASPKSGRRAGAGSGRNMPVEALSGDASEKNARNSPLPGPQEKVSDAPPEEPEREAADSAAPASAPKMPLPLNRMQQRAVLAGPGPVLALAGPGTGKTHTLTARIRHLLDAGTPAKRILVLTFTRRAAQELDNRLRLVLGEVESENKPNLPRTDTLHALALEFWFKTQGEAPVILDEESSLRVFAEANRATEARQIRRIWLNISLCREKQLPLPPEEQPLFDRYCAHKSTWNLADYTDLLEFWLTQARSGQYPPVWTQVLVDEIQDLSPLQLNLLAAVTRPGGDGFFGIGDPNQSIYGFRGAHGQAEEFFSRRWPGTKVIQLRENFRSGPDILHCAQALFADTPGVGKLVAKNPLPAEIHYFEANSAESEASWIAWQIRNRLGPTSHSLLDQSAAGNGNPARTPFSPGDFAVLLRSRLLMQPVRRALEMAGIPFRQPCADPFWNEPRVSTILQVAGSYLGISLPLPEKNLPRRRIPECPERILRHGPESLAVYWGNSDPFDAQFWKSGAFRELVRTFGLYGGWSGLLNWLSLQNELEQVQSRSEQVQILTLHASKGLEFRLVFLPALEEGLLPFAGPDFYSGEKDRAADSTRIKAEIDEERRLFYVGLTRAREGLFLSRAEKRRIYAREYSLPPSRFLENLPLERIRHSVMRASKNRKEEQIRLL